MPYADDSWRTQLIRLASRVAVNRTVAGVHFPVDSAAGCFLGLTLGEYFCRALHRRARATTTFGFDGSWSAPVRGGDPAGRWRFLLVDDLRRARSRQIA